MKPDIFDPSHYASTRLAEIRTERVYSSSWSVERYRRSASERWAARSGRFASRGWSVVEAEREEQAAVERVQHILSRLAQPAYRRKGAQRGAAQAVTLALFGNPLPYLLLSMLLHDEGAALPAPLADAELLSWEDERELGFPERRYGEPVQRTLVGTSHGSHPPDAYTSVLRQLRSTSRPRPQRLGSASRSGTLPEGRA